MTNDEPGLTPSLEDARLTSLDDRLRVAKREEAARTGGLRGPDPAHAAGQRVLADLIGGLVGGALIGWVLDRILGTAPGFLVGLTILGIVAGFWNIIKRSSKRS